MNTRFKESFDTVQTGHPLASNMERENRLAVQVVVLPPSTDGATVTFAHRGEPSIPGTDMDDLQLATWEDAEWQ